MGKTLTRCICAALAAVILVACGRTEKDAAGIRRVVLMYAAAYSNLSAAIAEDVNELCEGAVPNVGSSDVLLVYAHHVSRSQDYSTPTNPVLFRAYRDLEGKLRRDTVAVYPDTDVSSSPEVLHKVLSEVKERFPAKKYGLVFSSHARGWLPIDYSEPNTDFFFGPAAAPGAARQPKEYPLTKWLGIENVSGSGIDIRDLADAIPMKLEFFLMDACLMGCVEVAYELKDKCDFIGFSPTEILSNGFMYTTMASHLMGLESPELIQVCKEYYDFYQAQSGYYQSAAITLVDCNRIDYLAGVCANIVANHRSDLENVDRKYIQPYFYNNLHWFYDLRDVIAKSGASDSELAMLDDALSYCIVYTAATDHFFDLQLTDVCGLSMYFPYPDRDELNAYYKTLSWNKATGLIQ